MSGFLKDLKNEFRVENKNFYKIILMGLINSLFILGSFFNKYLVFVAFGVAVISLLLIKGVQKVYLMIFLYPFYGAMRLTKDNTPFMHWLVFVLFGVLLIELIIDIVKNKKKINIKLFLVCCLIAIYLFLPLGDYLIYRSFRLSAAIGVLYIVWEYRKDLGFKELALALSYGVLISCSIAPILYCVPRSNDLIGKFYVFKDFFRFTGLNDDPNFLGVKLILTISLLNVLYRNKEIKYFYWCMLFIVSCLGLLTLSKAFFIVFICYLILAMIESIFKKDWKYTLKYCLLTILIVSISWLCLNVFIRFMFDRFSSTGYMGSDDVMTNLTTGRNDLWMAYLKAWVSSPKKFLFGFGLGALSLKDTNFTAVHNLYIDMFYLIGLVGVLLIFIPLLLMFIKTTKKENRKFVNFIPAISVAIILFSLNSFISYRAYILVILLSFAMNYVKLQKEKI